MMVRRIALGMLTAAALAACVPTATAAPRQLEVRCTADGTSVAAPREVDVRMGGAFVHVTNASSRRLAVVVELGNDDAPSAQREILPGRTGWMRFALEPGQWRIGCVDPTDRGQDPPASPGYRSRLVPVRVLDPHGWYRAQTLACSEQSATIADYVMGARGETDLAKLPALAREAIPYARAGDVVGDAGYAVPQSTNRSYRLLRGDEVIGLVTFFDGGNGWLRNTTVTCTAAPAP